MFSYGSIHDEVDFDLPDGSKFKVRVIGGLVFSAVAEAGFTDLNASAGEP